MIKDIKNIKVLDDRLLIKIIKEEEKTAGGIIIPNKRGNTDTAKVIKIGTDECITVKEGDIVIFDKYGGIHLNFNDEDYLLIKFNDILAVKTD